MSDDTRLDGDLMDELATYGGVMSLENLRYCMGVAETIFRTGKMTPDERVRCEVLLAEAKAIS